MDVTSLTRSSSRPASAGEHCADSGVLVARRRRANAHRGSPFVFSGSGDVSAAAPAGRRRTAPVGDMLGRLEATGRGPGFMENNVVHAMYWIPPGRFLMGSPGNGGGARRS